MAGIGAAGTISLIAPHGVIVDGDGYLFIADFGAHRIIGSGPNGFRCIAGCSGVSGSASDQLDNPTRLNFDSDGNLFVVDKFNIASRNLAWRPTHAVSVSYDDELECIGEASVINRCFLQSTDIQYLHEMES